MSIRAAIQAILDEDGEGWQCAQWVVAVGLERVTSEGEIETVPWWTAPAMQAEWMSDALLEKALQLRAQADIE